MEEKDMKKLALLLLASTSLLAACGGGAAEDSSATGSEVSEIKETLVMGLDDTFAPMGFKDESGEIVGFDVELAKEVAERLDVEITFQPIDWAMKETELDSGNIDMIWNGYTITEERKQTMAFTDPYFDATQVIVVNDKGAAIKSAKDLEKHLVAVKTGTTGDIAISKLMGATNTNIKRYESLPLALKEVVAGGADAAVGDNGVVQNFVLNNNKDGKQLQLVSDPEFAKEHYGFALAKDRSDDLLAKLNSGIGKIKADGTYETIYQKWFGGQANAAASSASAAAPASAPASAAQ